MKISKLTFLMVNFQNLFHMAMNLSLQTWQLNENEKEKTIEKAIQEYFEARTSLLSVGIHLEYFQQWQIYINDYLTNVFKQTESMSFEIFVDHPGHGRKTRVFHHNVWYVDSHKAFSDLLPLLENNYVEVMGQYMVIMDAAHHLHWEEEIQQILETAFAWNIVHIAIATYVRKFTFNLYTYDIFQPQQCRRVAKRLYNAFRDGEFATPELFPQTLRNFHQCPIQIYVRPAVPFFSYNLTADQQRVAYSEGLEDIILNVMAERLNFRIQFKHWAGLGFGSVVPNGSVDGPFRMLRHSDIDILMGYFHSPIRFRYFAASIPYFLTPQVMVVRKRDQATIDGLWLMEPFEKSVWLVVFCTLVLAMSLISLLHWKLKIADHVTVPLTWLDVFGLSLGNYRCYDFHSYTTKYGFLMWTFGFMIICASFGGKLYGAFHRQPTTSPITVAQLIAENYTFFMKRFVTEDLVKDLRIPHSQIVNSHYYEDENIFKAMLHTNHNVAIVTNSWSFQAFLAQYHAYEEFDMVPKALVLNQVCAYMRPQSYLLEPFNHLLRHFKSVGIFQKWMLDAAHHYGIWKELDYEKTTEPKALSLKKIGIIFVGLFVLYGMALLVFLGEVLVKWKGQKKIKVNPKMKDNEPTRMY